MTVSVSVTGEDAARKKLDKLRRGMRTASRQSINRGLTVVKKAVAAEAPKGPTGNARRAIGKRLMKSKSGEAVDGKVGTHVAKKRRGKKGDRTAPHAHLIILGTQERYTKGQKRARRGVMPKNNFVDRGFAKSAAAATSVVNASFREKIERLAK